MMRKIGAWLNLAWFFALHVLTRMWLRPFRRGRDLARFNRTVGPEGYVPLLPPERAQFVRTMQCIHCGLCGLACTTVQSPMSAWDEAWTFAGGASRSLDYTGLIALDLPLCASDPATQAVCPTGVPINDMAAMIRRLAKT